MKMDDLNQLTSSRMNEFNGIKPWMVDDMKFPLHVMNTNEQTWFAMLQWDSTWKLECNGNKQLNRSSGRRLRNISG